MMRFFVAYPPSANNDVQTCHARFATLNFTILIPNPPLLWQVVDVAKSKKWLHRTKSLPQRSWKRLRPRCCPKLNGIPTRQTSCSLVTECKGRRSVGRGASPIGHRHLVSTCLWKLPSKYTITVNQGRDKVDQVAIAIVDMADTIVIGRPIANWS